MLSDGTVPFEVTVLLSAARWLKHDSVRRGSPAGDQQCPGLCPRPFSCKTAALQPGWASGCFANARKPPGSLVGEGGKEK